MTVQQKRIIAVLIVLIYEAANLGAATYTVRDGDTLYDIAQRYNTTANELARVNNLANPDFLQINEQLKVPGSGGTLSGPGGTGEIEEEQNNSLLQANNNLGGNSASSGLDLIGVGSTYTVQNGDTLYGIANRMGTSINSLMQNNGLSQADMIYVGDVLNITGNSSSTPTPMSPVGPSGGASSSRDSRANYQSLSSAASRAANGVSRDCYNTALRTARNNGASGDGWSWPSDTSYRGQSVRGGLQSAINDGTLKPGMAVYINRNPGTDPASVNLNNLPHWMTYLGEDSNGIPRFGDQYYSNMSLHQVSTYYGLSRRIDEFLDPYAS